jgi:predicted phage-related endonuclease
MSKDLTALHAQVEILRWCKMKAAELKELEAGAKAVIQEALGDQELGHIDGTPVVAWKSHKRTAVDQAYFKKTFAEVHAECLVTTEVRRFEVLDK